MKFTFIIPVYNYAQYLPQCIDSILRQDGSDYEIIIIDDGSIDNTSEVVSKIKEQHPKRKIIYFYQENAGPSAARNKGIENSAGDYIWCIDPDDRLLKDSIKQMIKAIELHPDCRFIFSGYRSVNESGKTVIHEPSILTDDRTENFRRYIQKKITGLATGSAIIEREVYKTVSFPVGIHNNEDMVFYAHLFALYPAISIPGIVLETYRHKKSLRNNMKRIEETGLKTVDRLFDQTFLTAEQMRFRKIYQARRNLSIFRSYYREGNFLKARRYYQTAISEYPVFLMQLSYLSKYIKCIVKKF